MASEEAVASARRLRWVTWWPVPYWIDRFQALADQPDVDFQAIFLAAGDRAYEKLRIDPIEWRFEHDFVSRRRSSAGFYRHARLPGNPLPLVAGGSAVTLVMTYAHPTYLAAAMLARLRRMPYHLFVANTEAEFRNETWSKEALKRWMFANATSCLATGPLQELYARRYVSSAPIHRIGNPVDNDRLLARSERLRPHRTELRRARGWCSDDVVVAFVGRLAPEKSLESLVEAGARLRSAGQPVRLAVAGGGPEEAGLRASAASANVPIDFFGFLNRESVEEVYAAADVFVLPSRSEPWGLVVNEAMLFGLPVVVSDNVGARHLIDPGESGFVFRAGDADDLAKKLELLAKDAELRSRFGEAARRAIEPCSIDAWVDSVLAALGIRGHPRPVATAAP